MASSFNHTSRLVLESSTIEHSKVFDQWEIEDFEILHTSEPKKDCLCGIQTRNICYIRNTSTNKKAQIALECAGKFQKGVPIYKFLKTIPKIFEGCRRILENFSAPASEELVEFAFEKGVFTEANKTFYDEHAKYSFGSLPIARQKYRKDLNQLLIAMLSSAKLAYNRLKERQTNIAAPRLIEYAFEKDVLSVHEKQLYLNLWKRVNIPFGEFNYLSVDEKKRLINLNEKIIIRLKSELLYLPNGQQQLTGFFGKSQRMPTGLAILFSPPSQTPRKRKRKEFETDSEDES
ncbi:MAG: hypothetical protein KR126chlam4_00341 [Candidatus Anoxychlamydiales bacterium]|nr:hypothetical protein [Candidatus Anoxychlamydiales bacterium]NGX40519.1 hypothetical protein [Candidatus Anoxychlamydiales bacterium]HEU64518.1 hypothetical protein [Chlamydiota bacterium]